jgi:predicted RNA-binding Zn ribbon-like protein
VDFLRYAESAAGLLNADLADTEALAALLADREPLPDQVVASDVTALRAFQVELRPVFEASAADDAQQVVDRLNALLAGHPITPMISDHDLDRLHLHVATRGSSVADLLVSESLLGLATLACEVGPTRLGVCAAAACEDVFVDTSPNHSRRYCSDRCSSRANVAAYRARQRASVS